jgi:ABC-type multidrug transport system ATPase subunit
MEEAEVLSNRIGILSQGSLKCIGTSLNLKNRFAQGYNLQINFQHEHELEVVTTIQSLFPEAEEVCIIYVFTVIIL